MKSLRILLIVDQPLYAIGLKQLVNSFPDMNLVGEASDSIAGVRMAMQVPSDVILLDLSHSELSAREAIARIRRSEPRRAILVFTDREDKAFASAVIRSGVNGYILKKASLEKLAQALRSVGCGSTYIDPVVVGHLVSPTPLSNAGYSDSFILSDRELAVLIGIAQGQLLKEIALSLNVGLRTIETYKYRGMKKLGLKNRTDLIRHAALKGWIGSSKGLKTAGEDPPS